MSAIIIDTVTSMLVAAVSPGLRLSILFVSLSQLSRQLRYPRFDKPSNGSDSVSNVWTNVIKEITSDNKYWIHRASPLHSCKQKTPSYNVENRHSWYPVMIPPNMSRSLFTSLWPRSPSLMCNVCFHVETPYVPKFSTQSSDLVWFHCAYGICGTSTYPTGKDNLKLTESWLDDDRDESSWFIINIPNLTVIVTVTFPLPPRSLFGLKQTYPWCYCCHHHDVSEK